MLCLQNPNGPNAVSECNQDVNAFYAEIAASAYGKKTDIPICIGVNSSLDTSNGRSAFNSMIPEQNKGEVKKQVMDRVSVWPASKKQKKKAKKYVNNLF